MLVSLLDTIHGILFSLLDPRHVGSICRLNRAATALNTASVRKASLDAAHAKYKKLIVLSDDTIRIHSRLGVTVVDLTLPTGEIHRHHNPMLLVMFNGQIYRGSTDEHRVCMDGVPCNLSPHVFHAKSHRLFQSGSVYIMGPVTVLPVVVHGGDVGMSIEVFVEENAGYGRIYTLNCWPGVW